MWSDTVHSKQLVSLLPDGLRLFDRLTGLEPTCYTGLRRGMDRAVVTNRARCTGLAVLGQGLAGFIVLSFALPNDVARIAVTLAGSAVTLGWALLPVVAYGIDETLDPARFATFAVSGASSLSAFCCPPSSPSRPQQSAALGRRHAGASRVQTGKLPQLRPAVVLELDIR